MLSVLLSVGKMGPVNCKDVSEQVIAMAASLRQEHQHAAQRKAELGDEQNRDGSCPTDA